MSSSTITKNGSNNMKNTFKKQFNRRRISNRSKKIGKKGLKSKLRKIERK
jgi:hypothetical protein